jgi:hypothetical protein
LLEAQFSSCALRRLRMMNTAPVYNTNADTIASALAVALSKILLM